MISEAIYVPQDDGRTHVLGGKQASPRRNAVWIIVLCLLGFAAVGSVAIGFKHGLAEGWDYQGDAARLIRHHVDVWDEAITLGPNRADYVGPPNYLHHMYVLLLPLTYLSVPAEHVVWSCLSISFSIISLLLLRRIFGLSVEQTLLALFLLWMSSPLRVTLEVGQASTFELMFLCLAFSGGTLLYRGLSLGVSFAKYSFAPLPVLILLLKGRLRLLSIAALVPVAGILVMRLLVPTPLSKLVFEPLRVANLPKSVSPGIADIMTFAQQILKHWMTAGQAQKAAYLLGLGACAAYAFAITRRKLSDAEYLTLISMGSLLFMKHLQYDFVSMVVVLCFALKTPVVVVRAVLLVGTALFWFAKPIMLAGEGSLGRLQPGLNVTLLLSLLLFTTAVMFRQHREGTQAEDGRSRKRIA